MTTRVYVVVPRANPFGVKVFQEMRQGDGPWIRQERDDGFPVERGTNMEFFVHEHGRIVIEEDNK